MSEYADHNELEAALVSGAVDGIIGYYCSAEMRPRDRYVMKRLKRHITGISVCIGAYDDDKYTITSNCNEAQSNEDEPSHFIRCLRRAVSK